MHSTRQVYRIATQFTDGGGKSASIMVKEKWYRVECKCGWRSAELPRPVAATCPVEIALAERARSLKRDFERIEWIELHSPVTEAEGNSK